MILQVQNQITMARPIIVILGAGTRTGLATATKFHEAGYEPIRVSRQGSANGQFKGIQADLSNVEIVGKIFEEIRHDSGEPEVVIYNGQ